MRIVHVAVFIDRHARAEPAPAKAWGHPGYSFAEITT